ncbi:MAG: hypothetical protein JWN73_3493 [Betaproteobacteria bacterium]|nr:hypothetical protein [Betaproteobacteria bacterium]
MLIGRWLILLAGLATCVSIALYLVTRNRMYWVLAKRIFTATAAAALVFFGVLILERLAML